MDPAKVREIIYSRIEELPTLPVIIPKLLSLVDRSDSNAADVTKLISQDPSLTAKILKVSNSAYYGFPQKISSLDFAVSLIGFNMLKTLALSIGVIQMFSGNNKNEYFTHDGLWLHSLGVATIIQEMGKRFVKNNHHDSLFIIGLLHDLGKLVLDLFFQDEFNIALIEANTGERTGLHVAEQKVIGIDHCEAGGMLLKRWNFPDEIKLPITEYHSKNLSEKTNPTDVSLLRIANALAQNNGIGEEGNTVPNEIHPRDMDVLGINDNDIETMQEYVIQIKEHVNEILAAMR